jgi:hypothetical protein
MWGVGEIANEYGLALGTTRVARLSGGDQSYFMGDGDAKEWRIVVVSRTLLDTLSEADRKAAFEDLRVWAKQGVGVWVHFGGFAANEATRERVKAAWGALKQFHFDGVLPTAVRAYSVVDQGTDLDMMRDVRDAVRSAAVEAEAPTALDAVLEALRAVEERRASRATASARYEEVIICLALLAGTRQWQAMKEDLNEEEAGCWLKELQQRATDLLERLSQPTVGSTALRGRVVAVAAARQDVAERLHEFCEAVRGAAYQYDSVLSLKL